MGATLKHPNIVPIMEVHSQKSTHFLVMKFVEGRNLREFIKIRKKFEPLQAAQLVVDIVAGLSYAFARGICHRDLKMSNVIVSSTGTAMLLDFGLAGGDKNLSDDAIAKMQNPRTIDYAGLERATGVRKDDVRSDIYFLGCIFYHMITGQAPLLETRDRIQRLSRSRFTDVVPILQHDPTLPKPIVSVVNRAMELNADQRYQTPGRNGGRAESGDQQTERPERRSRRRRNREARGRRRGNPAANADVRRIERLAARHPPRAAEKQRLSRAGHGRSGSGAQPLYC